MLADTFSLGDEPGKWEPPTPAKMPSRREVEAWISALEAQLEPASSSHIGFLVTTMANSMAMRQGQTQQMASRTDGWLIACGALPTDLWTGGCTDLLKTKTFMPSPGELMASVGPKFRERQRMLDRAKSLLPPPPTPKPAPPKEPSTPEFRLRTMRDSYRKHGRPASAAKAEQELAKIENREPVFVDGEEAALAGVEVPVKVEAPRAAPSRPSPGMEAALLRARARFWRAQGKTEMADRIAGQADALCPQEFTDVPEAAHG